MKVEAKHAVEELRNVHALFGIALHLGGQNADLGTPEAAAVVEGALLARHVLKGARQVVGALQVLRDLRRNEPMYQWLHCDVLFFTIRHKLLYSIFVFLFS